MEVNKKELKEQEIRTLFILYYHPIYLLSQIVPYCS